MVSARCSNRTHDVSDVEVAGGDLVKHRGKQKEIVAAHERDLDIWIRSEFPLQVNRGVDPTEPSAKHKNPRWCHV